MASATLTSKGQITIPREVRKALGLDTGDRLSFRVREDGVAELVPETVDFLDLAGCLKPRTRGVSLEDMEAAIAEGAGSR